MSDEKKKNIKVGKRYKLYAPWHPANGEMVEVIKKRKGISPSYCGKQIYHIATNPGDLKKRVDDFDAEFLDSHLMDPMEKMTHAPLDEYLDEKGLKNAETLKSHGIDVSLFRDENGDHYLEISHDGKSDLIKIEEYEGLKKDVEEDKSIGYSGISYGKYEEPEDDEKEIEGPPNPLGDIEEETEE